MRAHGALRGGRNEPSCGARFFGRASPQQGSIRQGGRHGPPRILAWFRRGPRWPRDRRCRAPQGPRPASSSTSHGASSGAGSGGAGPSALPFGALAARRVLPAKARTLGGKGAPSRGMRRPFRRSPAEGPGSPRSNPRGADNTRASRRSFQTNKLPPVLQSRRWYRVHADGRSERELQSFRGHLSRPRRKWNEQQWQCDDDVVVAGRIGGSDCAAPQ